MTDARVRIAVAIVSYGKVEDVRRCLAALAEAAPAPEFDVFVCENAGTEAFAALCTDLTAQSGVCQEISDFESEPEIAPSERLLEIKALSFRKRPTRVWIARAAHNLGYAGAINALIARLPSSSTWDGVWILNPDTCPDPRALAELVDRAADGNFGMVGSTIVDINDVDRVVCRGGLHLHVSTGRGIAIGCNTSRNNAEEVAAVEARMDCVSGASLFVKMEVIRRLGPMDERFFLYMEDVDWGVRAKTIGVKLGWAENSIVRHVGGSTLGTSSYKGNVRSWISIYLMNRNRLTFTRKIYPNLFFLTAAVSILHALRYLTTGNWTDTKTAFAGWIAGVRGEIGPPDQMVREGRAQARPQTPRTRFRTVKLLVSCAYFLLIAAWDRGCTLLGFAPKPRLTILYYHTVHSDFVFEFRRQMAALARWTNVVRADFRGTLPEGRKNVAITFDDALTSVFRNALPTLRRYAFPSTIFVPAGLMGRVPNWDSDDPSYAYEEAIMTAAQLKNLAQDGVTVGSHSMTHANLAAIPEAAAEHEIRNSRAELEQLLGRKVDLFSAPYGAINGTVIAKCETAGYQFIYTILPDENDTNAPGALRGRVRVDPWDSPLEFYLKSHGAYCWFAVLKAMTRALRC